MNIRAAPTLVTTEAGIAWLIFYNRSADTENQSIILKFALTEDAIQQLDFKLDDKFRISGVDGRKVFLSEGSQAYPRNHQINKGTFLDLETEKVWVAEIE